MTIAQRPWNAKQILTRAMKDEGFREALLANPKTLIEQELGVSLPQGVTIQAHEETRSTVHLVLPPRELGACAAPMTVLNWSKRAQVPNS